MMDGCPMCAEIGAHCGRHEEPTDSSLTPDTPECAHCARSLGLCRRHSRGILPQLAQPFWYRHAHSGLWTDEKEQAATMSPDARRVFNRKRTKEARRTLAAKQRAASLLSLLPPAA